MRIIYHVESQVTTDIYSSFQFDYVSHCLNIVTYIGYNIPPVNTIIGPMSVRYMSTNRKYNFFNHAEFRQVLNLFVQDVSISDLWKMLLLNKPLVIPSVITWVNLF